MLPAQDRACEVMGSVDRMATSILANTDQVDLLVSLLLDQNTNIQVFWTSHVLQTIINYFFHFKIEMNSFWILIDSRNDRNSTLRVDKSNSQFKYKKNYQLFVTLSQKFGKKLALCYVIMLYPCHIFVIFFTDTPVALPQVFKTTIPSTNLI